MKNQPHKVTYSTQNTYETLNSLTGTTKNVWIVFHGIGFLSRFFLKYFDELPKDEHYIIAPQAPSKYYLNNEYKHVGASWLTKVDTEQETNNILTYMDAILEKEKIPAHCNIILFGFSQGVSITMRYLAHAKLRCTALILYAGGIPHELKKDDFNFFDVLNTKIISIIGKQDEYLTPERLRVEREKLNALFGTNSQYITFDGGHEVRKEIINNLIE